MNLLRRGLEIAAPANFLESWAHDPRSLVIILGLARAGDDRKTAAIAAASEEWRGLMLAAAGHMRAVGLF